MSFIGYSSNDSVKAFNENVHCFYYINNTVGKCSLTGHTCSMWSNNNYDVCPMTSVNNDNIVEINPNNSHYYRMIDKEDESIIQYYRGKEMHDSKYFYYVPISKEEYEKAICVDGWFLPELDISNS